MSNGMSALLDLFISSARKQRLCDRLRPSVLFDCGENISTIYGLIGPKWAMYIEAPNKRNVLIFGDLSTSLTFTFSN